MSTPINDTPNNEARPTQELAAALKAARDCIQCSAMVVEYVQLCDPDTPDDDPAWIDMVRGSGGEPIGWLRDHVLEAMAAIPPVVPTLMRAAPQSAVVRMPADAGAALPARSLTKATAHETALSLAVYVLHRVWRAGDPSGHQRAMLNVNVHPLTQLDWVAVGRGARAVCRELAAVLPAVEEDELIAACERESAQAVAFLERQVAMPEAASAAKGGGAAPSFRHSLDFRSVFCHGTTYTFTREQAAVVGVLWEAWSNGTPVVGKDRLLLEAECNAKRLSDLFKRHEAWGKLIVTDGRGGYRLNPPE